jgi:hypothetical protein
MSGGGKDGMDFDRGELVRLRTDRGVVGQVIDECGWGSSFQVRIVGEVEPQWFENIELETYVPDGPVAGFGHDDEPPKNMKPGSKQQPAVINLAAERAARKGGMH